MNTSNTGKEINGGDKAGLIFMAIFAVMLVSIGFVAALGEGGYFNSCKETCTPAVVLEDSSRGCFCAPLELESVGS